MDPDGSGDPSLCVHSPILRGVHCSKKKKKKKEGGKRNGGRRKKKVNPSGSAGSISPRSTKLGQSLGFRAPLLPTESILEHTRALLGFWFHTCSQGPAGLMSEVFSLQPGLGGAGAQDTTQQFHGRLTRAPGRSSSPAPEVETHLSPPKLSPLFPQSPC